MSLMGFIDERRTVIAMAGADARAVLQNIVTNDVDAVAPDQMVYAALLTPQGKYLFDFFLIDGAPFGWSDGTILIDTALDRAAVLAQRLKLYCLRRDAQVEQETGLSVGVAWGSGEPPDHAIRDPRNALLGWRIYDRDQALPADVQQTDRAGYDALRVSALIPESGIELVPEDTYILEAGFERLSGVDFRKGCYVGQEVTARMKHKAQLRKGLVQVEVQGDVTPGTEILADGKVAGTLFSTSGGHGLAHLRLDRAGEGMVAGAALVHYRGAQSSI